MAPVWRAEVRRATSCLISGGCDASGRVPVTQHLRQIKAIRQGRKMNWHVGLIEEADLRVIAPYTDVVSFDFVGDDETIHEVYGLDRTVADYVRTYQTLRRHTRVIPHITIGLRGGAIGHEYPAMEKLQELGVEGLVFIASPGLPAASRRVSSQVGPPGRAGRRQQDREPVSPSGATGRGVGSEHRAGPGVLRVLASSKSATDC